ncbi:hypothetical protein CLOM_g1787, partial [Closterium sp. NIES-68]
MATSQLRLQRQSAPPLLRLLLPSPLLLLLLCTLLVPPLGVGAGQLLDASSVGALQAFKSALGVTYSDWNADLDCCFATCGPTDGWTNVFCDGDGQVTDITFQGGSPLSPGPLPLQLSSLTALTYIMLRQLRIHAELKAFTQHLSAVSGLQRFDMAYNFLYGSIPAALVTMPALTILALPVNYLTGSIPQLGSQLVELILASNYLSSSFPNPSTPLASCSAYSTCLTDFTGCPGSVRTSGVCGTICGGGCGEGEACAPLVEEGTMPGNTIPMECAVSIDSVPPRLMHTSAAAAMLLLRRSLGVTFTDWTATSLCLVSGGSMLTPHGWTGVRCDSQGHPIAIDITATTGQFLLPAPSFPSVVSTLQALSSIALPGNGIYTEFKAFAWHLSRLTSLKHLDLSSNVLYGPIHSSLLTIPTLTSLTLSDNYLSGCIPALGSQLLSLSLSSNYLSSSFPMPPTPLPACSAHTNCLTDVSACNTSEAGAGNQRSASECAICGGGCAEGVVCAPNLMVLRRAQSMQSTQSTQSAMAAAATLSYPMSCFRSRDSFLPVAMAPDAVAAMLALKTGLHVPFTDWVQGALCSVEWGADSTTHGWTAVTCNGEGHPTAIAIDLQELSGSFPSEMSALTALTHISLINDRIVAEIGALAQNLPSITNLQYLDMAYNFLYGFIPETLLTLPALTFLSLSVNYLSGSIPQPGSQLLELALSSNYLSSSFPSSPTPIPTCTAFSTCLTDFTGCPGSLRTSGDCGTICGGGCGEGEACAPLVEEGIEPGSIIPMGCAVSIESVPPRLMHTSAATAMLLLKRSLGVTFTDWTTASLCLTPGGSMLTPHGWTGVLCDSQGHPIAINITDATGQFRLPAPSFPSVVSTLQALSSIALPGNSIYTEFKPFAWHLSRLSSLKHLDLSSNLLYGPIHSSLVTIATLTSLTLSGNYLSGSIPALGSQLLSLSLASNFLSSSFPTLPTPLPACSAHTNCLTDVSACNTSEAGAGNQRSGSECAICGGGCAEGKVCAPNLMVWRRAKSMQSTQSTLAVAAVATLSYPMSCFTSRDSFLPVAMAPAAAAAMLALKTSLHVPFTDWLEGALCSVEWGTDSTTHGWTAVTCNGDGHPTAIAINLQELSGSFPRQVSALTALTHISLINDRIVAEMGVLAANLPSIPNLQYLELSYNFIYGTLPTAILAKDTLTSISLASNYLSGSIPAVGSQISELHLPHNYLTGTFPSSGATFASCTCADNCLQSAVNCNAGDEALQRESGCDICSHAIGTVQPCGANRVCAPEVSPAAEPASLLPMTCH